MSRIVKNWKPDRVENATVAPHRYLWAGTILPDGSPAKDLEDCESWREAKANIPYCVGEVVYVQYGDSFKKALIKDAFIGRNTFTGERREVYNVQYETAKGLWSKRWTRAYPGYIQRGYFRAGLAPDYKE